MRAAAATVGSGFLSACVQSGSSTHSTRTTYFCSRRRRPHARNSGPLAFCSRRVAWRRIWCHAAPATLCGKSKRCLSAPLRTVATAATAVIYGLLCAGAVRPLPLQSACGASLRQSARPLKGRKSVSRRTSGRNQGSDAKLYACSSGRLLQHSCGTSESKGSARAFRRTRKRKSLSAAGPPHNSYSTALFSAAKTRWKPGGSEYAKVPFICSVNR